MVEINNQVFRLIQTEDSATYSEWDVYYRDEHIGCITTYHEDYCYEAWTAHGTYLARKYTLKGCINVLQNGVNV